MDVNQIITGDSLDVLGEFEPESVHAVVSDPPYGLAFMGRSWDDFEPLEYQKWCHEWATECLRVLKPGGHLLAFSGNRTHHRLFTGIEDAGFEIRDTITWHYGNGFPKASDISKTIDKREGAERSVIGKKRVKSLKDAGGITKEKYGIDKGASVSPGAESKNVDITVPSTPDAKKWDGWKTGLKPATEFVVMARKPFDGATVDCLLEYGSGALNIGACRVGSESTTVARDGKSAELGYMGGGSQPEHTGSSEGRYPANVVFHYDEAKQLDADVGELSGGAHPSQRNTTGYSGGLAQGDTGHERKQLDSGGPSRYFYTSKATQAERTLNGMIDNAHPTVKPLDLMEWLVRLVSARGQLILDPFAGTGTTCIAAKNLDREFIGIEQQAKWADVSRARIGLDVHDSENINNDDSQTVLEAFGV